MRVYLCLAAIAAVISCVTGNALPSFIKACSASDPNLNQCIEDVITSAGPKFARGIPELGIKPLDPVELGKVVVDNPALKLTFEDTVVTGLAGFKINTFKLFPEKGKAIVDFTANVTLKAHYIMDGQVLILPIKGDGQAKIKITNLNINIKYDYKTVDGFWTVTAHKDEYKMDRAQFKFTNLFNGNKELADTTLKFLNENWSIIMQEIAPPAMDQVIESCLAEVKKFYSVVPADLLLAN
ncbi:circadian clock-controlled protein daywake-like [Danaus plexippus]|uniref:circadian clock-controlled protein daywake-like n=1 Tax=Danaus plexippus TaxID=13037 RepID=UPI002AB20492|nr:circadian clock-controlled protein daywake-like [Danaus plexippus]